jgi:hypothetical protein
MELHKAIKHIVQTDGQDALLEPRLVNILDDLKAYEDMPSAKYILRAIIADGCMQKLLQVGVWNATAKQLSQKFASITGFMPENVELIFQSIAYGLNWISQIKIHRQTTHSEKNLNPLSKWSDKMPEEEQEKYILSLFDFDHSKEPIFDVYLQNISFEIEDNGLIMYYELYSNGKQSKCVELHYALYDLKGRIRGTNAVDYRYNTDINPKPGVCYLDDIKIDQISRIRLWWQ